MSLERKGGALGPFSLTAWNTQSKGALKCWAGDILEKLLLLASHRAVYQAGVAVHPVFPAALRGGGSMGCLTTTFHLCPVDGKDAHAHACVISHLYRILPRPSRLSSPVEVYIGCLTPVERGWGGGNNRTTYGLQSSNHCIGNFLWFRSFPVDDPRTFPVRTNEASGLALAREVGN